MEEPLFAKDNENHGNNCEVPTNVLMEFILSEGAYVLSGYALDINENLRIDTAVDLEQYGEEFVKNTSVRALEWQSTKGTVDGGIRLIFSEGEVQYWPVDGGIRLIFSEGEVQYWPVDGGIRLRS